MDESEGSECLCHICQTLHQPKENFELVDFGTLEQLCSRRTCPVCRLVAGLLPNKPMGECISQQQIAEDVRWHQKVKLRKMGRDAFVVWLHETIQGELGYFFPHDKIKVHPVWSFALMDIALRTTSNVDYVRLNQWITECDAGHPKCTKLHALRSTSPPINTWLIDTLDHCLVQKTTNNRYLALSYVRGHSIMFEATCSNREQLQQPGALRRAKCLLNPIVQDAIDFTRLLGLRYLWVDALCILQDDGAEKAKLIMQMDAIYAHAFLTIVALTAENGESRLPGVEMGTLQKSAASVEFQISCTETVPNRYCAVRPSLQTLLGACAYNSRGWTFQESMLSKRCVIFTDHQIFFHCSSGLQTDCEVVCTSDIWPCRNILSSVYTKEDHILDVDGQFGLYTSLVRDFSKRNLTYPEDSLNAIRGVLAVLSNHFGWRFTSGLPCHLLHHALLWRSASPNHLRNRAFPSWSWAGWIGCLNWNIQNLMDPAWIGDELGNAPLTSLLFEAEISHAEAAGSLDGVEVQSLDRTRGMVLRVSSNVVRSNVFKISFMAPAILHHQNRSGMCDIPLSSYKEIRTAEDLRCGILYDFQGDLNENLQFVALSRSRWTEERHKYRGRIYGDDFVSWHGHIFDDEKLAFSEYCIVNVMLVEVKEKGIERVGIGWIHYDVWRTVDKTWRSIDLK